MLRSSPTCMLATHGNVSPQAAKQAHPPLLKHSAQLLLRLPCLGHQQQPASGLIQAVHVARPPQRTHR